MNVTGDPAVLQTLHRLQQARERTRQQEACRHTYRSVPYTSAYLQCPKCGHRIADD